MGSSLYNVFIERQNVTNLAQGFQVVNPNAFGFILHLWDGSAYYIRSPSFFRLGFPAEISRKCDLMEWKMQYFLCTRQNGLTCTSALYLQCISIWFISYSVVSRAHPCVLDAQIMILDVQNSSEYVNLDAQIVLLDTQNRSSGIQLVDFESLFPMWQMKYKWVCPNRFRKCIQMQIRCASCTGDTFSTSLIGAFPSVSGSASSAVVVYNSQTNQLI